MTSSGKQTMSASAWRARSIHSTTSFVFPARSPTVGLTCASAILTTQLSLVGRLYHFGRLELLRTPSRALARAPDLAVRRPRSGSAPHRGRRGGSASPLPRRRARDGGACLLLQAQQRLLGAVRARRLEGAAGAS